MKCTKLQPSRVRELSDVERAWVGAMIDGEGSILTAPRASVVFANTGVELVATMLRVVGAGSVCLQNRIRKPQHNQSWYWQLQRTYEAINLLAQVSVYSIKAQIALTVLRGRGMVPSL